MWGQIDRIDIRCLLCLWTCCTVHGHSALGALDAEIDLPTSWQTSPCTRCHSSAPPQLVLSGAVPRAEHLLAGGQNQCESPDRGTQNDSTRALPCSTKLPPIFSSNSHRPALGPAAHGLPRSTCRARMSCTGRRPGEAQALTLSYCVA